IVASNSGSGTDGAVLAQDDLSDRFLRSRRACLAIAAILAIWTGFSRAEAQPASTGTGRQSGRTTDQPSDSSGAPSASPALRVSPRSYWGQLKYSPSSERSAELLRGNCLDRKLKIEVDSRCQVTWEIREATRRSEWAGRIEPHTGEIEVVAQDVTVFAADG